MDFFQFMLIILHISSVPAKSKKNRYDTSSSDETIENLLYFKDCQKKPTEKSTTTTHRLVPLRMPSLPPPTPPPQPECPFPKMCCSLSCGNECNGGIQSSFNIRHNNLNPFSNFPQDIDPLQRNVQQTLGQLSRKRKKMKLPEGKMQPPINGRRDSGFAKAKIKTLISEDSDIRKILKDLVRVTMQKVHLSEMTTVSEAEPIDIQEFYTTTTTEAEGNYDEYIE